MDFRPTHTCFDDALDFYMMLRRVMNASDAELNAYELFHAICLMPGTRSERMAHAWNRDPRTGDVVQAGLVDGSNTRCWYALADEVFEGIFRPQYVVRYTFVQALRENHRANHFGPWDPEIRQYCTDERRVAPGAVHLYRRP